MGLFLATFSFALGITNEKAKQDKQTKNNNQKPLEISKNSTVTKVVFLWCLVQSTITKNQSFIHSCDSPSVVP